MLELYITIAVVGFVGMVASIVLGLRAFRARPDAALGSDDDRPALVAGTIGTTKRTALDLTPEDRLEIGQAITKLLQERPPGRIPEVVIERLGVTLLAVVVTPTAYERFTLEISCPVGRGFDAAHIVGLRFIGPPERWYAKEIVCGPNSRALGELPAIDLGAFACSDEDGFVATPLGILSGVTRWLIEIDFPGTDRPKRSVAIVDDLDFPTLTFALVLVPVPLSAVVSGDFVSPRVNGVPRFVS